MAPDPYQVLGVRRSAPDAEVRAAYRRLVQLHHPDHNGGSAESARRFEEVQEAYGQIRAVRRGAGARTSGSTGARRGSTTGARPSSAAGPRARPRTTAGGQAPPRPSGVDPDLEGRLAEMERQLREAQLARERARQAARDAAAQTTGRRQPTDEELGYVKTDDSFSKILADARSEIAQRYSGAREHPVTQRVADLIDEMAAKLTGEDRPRRDK